MIKKLRTIYIDLFFVIIINFLLLFFIINNPVIRELLYIFPIILLISILVFYFRKKFLYLNKIILIFFLIFIIIIFYKSSLFTRGPVIHGDFTIDYYYGTYLSEVLLPKFKNIIGWDPNFQAGYNIFYDIPPGKYLIFSFIYYLFFNTIPADIILRFVILLSFVFPIITIYLYSKKISQSSIAAAISSFLWLSFTHDLFFFGNIGIYYGIGFLFLTLYFFHQYFNNRKNSYLILFSLSLGLVVLFHSLVFIFTFFYVILFSIFMHFQKKSFPFKKITLACILSLLIGSIYFVEYFLGTEYLIRIYNELPKTWSYIYNLENNFFVFVFSTPLIIILPLFSISLISKKNKEILFILIFCIFLFSFIVFIHELRFIISNPFLQAFGGIDKLMMILRGFLIVITSFSLVEIFNFLNKENFLHKILILLLIFILFYNSIPYLIYLTNVWPNPNGELYTKTANVRFIDAYGLELPNGLFEYNPNKDVIEVFQFLNNTNISGRILFNLNGEKSGYKLGGSIYALSSLYTHKFFVGGPSFNMLLPLNEIYVSNNYEDNIFGKKISDYSLEEFKGILNTLNIEYVIAWHPNFISFLNNHEEFDFVNKTSTNLLRIYKYKNSPKNYISSTNKNIKSNLIYYKEDEIKFEISNTKKGDLLVLSQRYSPNWIVLVDNDVIQTEITGLSMTKINVPKDGNFILEFKYNEGILQKFSKFLSLFSFIFLFILFLLYKKRKD